MSRQTSLEAVPATTTNVNGPVQTAIALPPSSDDPATDKMRVRVNGIEITRQYDPTT